MRIGVPKEIKTLEFRVGMTPAGAYEMVHDGHEVFVETNAGAGIGVTDADYESAGAKVLGNISIGDCARIAAGSVVLKDVEACTTVAGVPAKYVGPAGCPEPGRTMNQMLGLEDMPEGE